MTRCDSCGEAGFMRLVGGDRWWCQVCGTITVESGCSGATVA